MEINLFFTTCSSSFGGGAPECRYACIIAPSEAKKQWLKIVDRPLEIGRRDGAPLTDYAGDPRPFNGVTDIGAYEYSGGEECPLFYVYLPMIVR